MAHSIECRVPLLDQDLIQYVRENAAYNRLVRQNRTFDRVSNTRYTKIALKELAASIFGTEFAYRRKEGLHLPFNTYFYGEDRERIDELLSSLAKRDILNGEYVLDCYRSKTHLSNIIWRAVTLEMWCEIFIDCEDSRL